MKFVGDITVYYVYRKTPHKVLISYHNSLWINLYFAGKDLNADPASLFLNEIPCILLK